MPRTTRASTPCARTSKPRYNKEAAQLAWDRTMAFFKANLA
jgi:dienelactone hydrolase